MKHFDLDSIEWTGRFGWQKALLCDEVDLDSPGSKVQILKLVPGVSIAEHVHRVRTEVFVVLGGSGTLVFDGVEYASKTGSIHLCPINTVHALRNDSLDEDFLVAVFRTNDPGESDMIWVSEQP